MIATIFGWACVACLGLVAMLEPKEPKKDGRFRTGYKNNATRPVKSEKTKHTQIFFIVIGTIAGIIWYFAR